MDEEADNDGADHVSLAIKNQYIFLYINPRKIRNARESKCINFVRFSNGPPIENLEVTLEDNRILEETQHLCMLVVALDTSRTVV